MGKFTNILFLTILSTGSAQASGFVHCELTATVDSILSLGVLDDTVTMNRMSKTDTYQYIGNFKISASKLIDGNGGECPSGDHPIKLKNKDHVKAGDAVVIDYHLAHDRPGSSVTYKIKK